MISIIELSILSLNIWFGRLNNRTMKCKIIIKVFFCRGIPFISKDRTVRVNAISKEIAKGDYDVVSLQEVSRKIKIKFIYRFQPFIHVGLE